MNNLIKYLAIISLVVVAYRLIKTRLKYLPKDCVAIDRNQYELLLGKDATEAFTYYHLSKMHGLSIDGAISRIVEGGTYIDGLSNYHPDDKELDMKLKPFLFLNIGSIQNNYSNGEVYTLVMHECMHMAGKLYNGCWDSHEEEMITWAEQEANQIVKILKDKQFI